MKAGSLNKRITFRAKSAGEDSLGQPIETWADVCTVWAAKSDITGKEYLSADAEKSSVTTRFFIRKRSGLNESMQIVHGTDTYNIKAILDDGKGRQLQIMAERI